MRPQEKLTGRAVTLLFAVVFLTAAQGQALGLRHCSLHDALPGTVALSHDGGHFTHEGVPRSPSSADPDPREAHGHDHAAQEGQHSGAPGGCMDDCHVGTTTVASPVSPPVSAPALHPASGPVGGTGGPVGPRHHTYELHLPNAPPLFA